VTISLDLPRTEAVVPPRRLLLHALRPTARAILRRRFDVRVLHDDRVPVEGPLIVAGNHVGILDGPLLAIFTPRPVHALTKEEMFSGHMGRFLHSAGQIPLNRYAADPRALKTCLRVLRDGHAIGVFPEGGRGDGELSRFHHGAAYLALATGATVVPLMMFGTRPPGGGLDAMPEKGSDGVVLWFGEPWQVDPMPWPRSRAAVLDASALLRERMLGDLHAAKAETGRTLPGPIAGPAPDDPDTGFDAPAHVMDQTEMESDA
jgi:1-acyl-sn-glycerol-3-phosphate acyltransferase